VGGGAFLGDVKPSDLNICWSVDCMGTYDPVLSCQAFDVTTSRGPNSDGADPVLEAPRRGCREPGHVSRRVMRMGRNRHPSVPWVQDPDSSPRACHRAGGRSRSLDGRQNKYSRITAFTIAGLSHDHGAS
jgi:hypothetical protein